MEPGGDYGESPNGHKGDELGIVMEGKMEITVEDEVYILEEGDCIYIKAFVPHKYRNFGNTPCSSLWVVQGSD
jgi:mannose-6-phosphate isomerase-like protein (cupin superfamily)